MKITAFTLCIALAGKFVMAQSPFDLGQNKDIWFISNDLRDSLGLKEIVEVFQLLDGETGGMHENWDINTIKFGFNEPSIEWSILSTNDRIEFHYDSIVENARLINGTYYNIADNQLQSYGGGGYGAFDWYDYHPVSDTVSMVTVSCVGHCGPASNISYYKYVYDARHRLKYKIRLFSIEQQLFDSIVSEDASHDPESMALTEMELVSQLQKKVSSPNPDTVFYFYDKQGRFKQSCINGVIKNVNDYITGEYSPDYFKFYQCFVEQQPFEDYIQEKIGYLPKLILFELYKNAVVKFYYDDHEDKYYYGSAMMLE